MTNPPKTTAVDDARVMRIWRECGLPEYFLGNGGWNSNLVKFADAIDQDDNTNVRQVAREMHMQDEARISDLEAKLQAMTEDRDLWQDAHDDARKRMECAGWPECEADLPNRQHSIACPIGQEESRLPICGNSECICCGSATEKINQHRELGIEMAQIADGYQATIKGLQTQLDEAKGEIAKQDAWADEAQTTIDLLETQLRQKEEDIQDIRDLLVESFGPDVLLVDAITRLQAQLCQEREAHAEQKYLMGLASSHRNQLEAQISQLQTTVGQLRDGLRDAMETIRKLDNGQELNRISQFDPDSWSTALATCPAPAKEGE